MYSMIDPIGIVEIEFAFVRCILTIPHAHGTLLYECEWYGIECRSSPADEEKLQIRSIQLDSNNIQNTIPDEIHYLSTLQTISMRSDRLSIIGYYTINHHPLIFVNSLSGTITSFVASPTAATTTYLTAFELDTNYMYGTVPDWLFTNYNVSVSWKRLSLHSNVVSGSIPSSIGTSSSMQNLYLHNNQLSGMYL